MRADFHIHSIFSDGELLPSEIVSRCKNLNHQVVGIADHIDHSNLDSIEKIREIKDKFNGINLVIGAEITHVSPSEIDNLVAKAKRKGAELIVVHGETTVEPVPEGTNRAAVNNEGVNILAHPGLIGDETAEKAQKNNVFLELTSRRGHCYTNGHVARTAKENGANLILNTDAHSPTELVSREKAIGIARGAGLTISEARRVVEENPKTLLKEIGGGEIL